MQKFATQDWPVGHWWPSAEHGTPELNRGE
jgi:hypothetical protein